MFGGAFQHCATVLGCAGQYHAGVAVPGTGSGFSCAVPRLALHSVQAGSRTPLL